jgi:hypothetical protein
MRATRLKRRERLVWRVGKKGRAGLPGREAGALEVEERAQSERRGRRLLLLRLFILRTFRMFSMKSKVSLSAVKS